MKAISTLVLSNLRLSCRVRIAFFFNFIFPILMAFAYCRIFAGGIPAAVARMMGPLITLTIMTNALLLSGMRLAEMRERGMLRQFHLTPASAFHGAQRHDLRISHLLAWAGGRLGNRDLLL